MIIGKVPQPGRFLKFKVGQVIVIKRRIVEQGLPFPKGFIEEKAVVADAGEGQNGFVVVKKLCLGAGVKALLEVFVIVNHHAKELPDELLVDGKTQLAWHGDGKAIPRFSRPVFIVWNERGQNRLELVQPFRDRNYRFFHALTIDACEMSIGNSGYLRLW